MREILKKLGRLLTDGLGVALIIVAVFFGWIPGISGIPIFLAGLGLLAMNHDWAKKWLGHIRNHGSKLASALFSGNPTIMLLDDVLAIAITALSVAILVIYEGSLARAVAFLFLTAGLMIFSGNRQRIQRVSKLWKRKHK